MLIDDFLPEYDFVETHSIDIDASPEKTYWSAQNVDFSDSFVVKSLLRLRGMSPTTLSFKNLQSSRFRILGEEPGKEIVIGLIGRFWLPSGDLQDIIEIDFRRFEESGFAKAAWNFSLKPISEQSRLTTQTRIKCIDRSSRRYFGFYWTLIRPFSSWIRSEMLRTIKKQAESGN